MHLVKIKPFVLVSHLTCTGADPKGLVFVSTEDAVSDAVPAAVWMLGLGLSNSCACLGKIRKNVSHTYSS